MNRRRRKQPFHFDSIGLSLLVIVMVCWEVMLSKGQEWDWLGDPFWRVQTLVIFFTLGLVGLIFWELRHRHPVVNFRLLSERNFAACCIIIFSAYLALYAASTSLPGLLQSLFGYDALSAGLVMSPGGLFAVLAMPIIALSRGRQLLDRIASAARWAGWIAPAGGLILILLAVPLSLRSAPPGERLSAGTPAVAPQPPSSLVAAHSLIAPASVQLPDIRLDQVQMPPPASAEMMTQPTEGQMVKRREQHKSPASVRRTHASFASRGSPVLIPGVLTPPKD